MWEIWSKIRVWSDFLWFSYICGCFVASNKMLIRKKMPENILLDRLPFNQSGVWYMARRNFTLQPTIWENIAFKPLNFSKCPAVASFYYIIIISTKASQRKTQWMSMDWVFLLLGQQVRDPEGDSSSIAPPWMWWVNAVASVKHFPLHL